MMFPRSNRSAMPETISALAVLVIVEDVLALGVAGALDDDLLRGLRGDPPEALAVGLQPEDVAVALVLDPRLFLVLGR